MGGWTSVPAGLGDTDRLAEDPAFQSGVLAARAYLTRRTETSQGKIGAVTRSNSDLTSRLVLIWSARANRKSI